MKPEVPASIPREVLFGNPERSNPQLSPDGRRLGWLAPDEQDVLQVWVQDRGAEAARKVTADKKRGIRAWFWCDDNRTLIYLQDTDGDENWHLFGVDLESGNVRDYTPFQGVQASPVEISAELPDTLLVALNLRNRAHHDIYRVTLSTGAVELDTENPGDVAGWVAGGDLQIRACTAVLPNGDVQLRIRSNAGSPWRVFQTGGPDESIHLYGFSHDNKRFYVASSLGSDTARLLEVDIETFESVERAASPEVDVEKVMIHPVTHRLEAVGFTPGRLQWTVLDTSLEADFAGIANLFAGDFEIVSRTRADDRWLVGFTTDQGSVTWFEWDRASRTGRRLFSARPRLEGLPLSAMTPVKYQARDGLTIHGYLSRPRGRGDGPHPMVLLVHGGPWVRDYWGFEPQVQWLCNRGYAVLQVNYRGSTGYGKRFLAAGYKEWSRRMHDDLIDACEWAVAEGVADRSRIAIFGGSYGGYAALCGVTMTPEYFACSVDIVGPSSIRSFVEAIPPYWKALRGIIDTRVANIDDPADAHILQEASPLFYANRIVRPLLIAQGANDPRVPQPESEQIVAEIKKHGGSVTYVLYPDEGHGFARPANRLDFYARAELFMATWLGGQVEDFPEHGSRVPGSSAQVRTILNGQEGTPVTSG